MSNYTPSNPKSKADQPDENRESALRDALTGDLGSVRGTDRGGDRPTRELVPGVEPKGPSESTGPLTAVLEGPGTRIGSYRLLQKLGEGGMGVVYDAEQEHPVRRRVALKVIKPGMDSAQVVARFEAERQALALMDHANIARVLDAGSTGSGRPYFVMELVHGIPLTRYCDENKLTPRARLELFISVCQAIQHAHQKGIIHRDIKPSNVLVTLYDGKPVPKVIDFGIAKATEQRLTERTMFTQYGTVIGTLEYMSPEQAELSALGVDTRSDIYSLGVMLYELLTGTTPLERKQVRELAYRELVRMIKEDEPPRPSTRLSQSGETLTAISSKRGLEPGQLRKVVQGELDWIVMKCLEKDRTRRYETANGLARDIERYLHDEAVTACPPSGSYRLRKFARKHRRGLATAAIAALLLVAGLVASTWQAVRATRAEEATRAALAAEAEQRRLAEQREAETRAVLDFVDQRVFAAARPEGQQGGLGRDVTLRRAVESAVPYLATSFRDQSLVEARLRSTLGTSFFYLGEAKLAAEHLEIARVLYITRLGPNHPDTLMSMNDLALSYAGMGRHADALKLREETLALRKAKLGPDHPDTLMSMNNLAISYHDMGRHADALKLCEETLALRKAKLGPDHPETLRSMNNLAVTYAEMGRHTDALKLHEETLALQKARFGPDHLETLKSMHNLAKSYAEMGRQADALKLEEETLALRKAKLGPDHPDTLRSMTSLAIIYSEMRRHADALKLREETLALQKTKLGSDHPNALMSMISLAVSYAAVGRHHDAIKLLGERQALQAKRGPDHPDMLYNIACLYATIAKSSDHAAEAGVAVEWLKKAIAGGYKKAQLMKTDPDLAALQDRDDFKKVVADLEAENAKQK
jgi:serine/threonine protein kinase/tetratricopeptide (TPR) repeat protein